MSGDVRKRREKKRKKEDSVDEPVPPVQARRVTPSPISDDVNIHIHKDHGTGGGICAKLVFFVLLGILAVLVGLIITEHRGLTDLDTSSSESRFAQIFDGWIEEKGHDHDDHDTEVVDSHEDDEDDDHDAHDDDHEEHDDEDHDDEDEEDDHDEEASEEEEDEEETEESQPEDSAIADSEQQDSAADEDDDDDDNADDEDDEVTQEAESEEQTVESEEQGSEAAQSEEADDDDEADEEEEADAEASEEDDAQSPETNDQDSNEIDDNEQSEEKESKEKETSQQDDDEDDDDDTTEQTVEEQSSKEDNDDDDGDDAEGDTEKEGEEEQQPEEKEPIGVAKVGVGVALLVVAYVVLVRKWKNDSPNTVIHNAQASEANSVPDQHVYEKEQITNNYDNQIKELLDNAENQINENPILAQKLFQKILDKFPNSARAIYGIAETFNRRVKLKPTLETAWEAVNHYLKVLKNQNVPDTLYVIAAEGALKHLRMIGKYSLIVNVQRSLIERFPQNVTHQNQLVVTYLTVNKIPEARRLVQSILIKWPNDGFALVHYGFILKTVDNDLKRAIDYLHRGIITREPGVIDGRFYFHLGDAYARIGQQSKATEVYEDGVKNKLFLSKYQRSLYNVDHLTGRPWWNLKDTPYREFFNILERHYKQIKAEGLAILNVDGYFKDESENLKDMGDWKQFELFARGMKNKHNCDKCPFTCSIVESLSDATRCKRGQIKFSVMHPGTHVWPHCGPTNCRLRAHLGLKVPPKTYIRVAEETRSWQEGKVLMFDDSFEHEVWHNGSEYRLVLIVDVWHHELSALEKKNLRPI